MCHYVDKKVLSLLTVALIKVWILLPIGLRISNNRPIFPALFWIVNNAVYFHSLIGGKDLIWLMYGNKVRNKKGEMSVENCNIGSFVYGNGIITRLTTITHKYGTFRGCLLGTLRTGSKSNYLYQGQIKPILEAAGAKQFFLWKTCYVGLATQSHYIDVENITLRD